MIFLRKKNCNKWVLRAPHWVNDLIHFPRFNL